MKKALASICIFIGCCFNSVYAQFEKFDYFSSLIDDGLYEQALKGIQTHALEDEKDILQLWYLTVKLYCALGNPQKAEEYLQKALPNISREDLYFRFAKINIDLARGRLSAVQSNFQSLNGKIQKGSPADREFILLKAKAQIAVGDFKKARLLVTSLSDRQDGQLEAARIFMNMGLFSQAEEILYNLVQGENISGRAYLFLGQVDELSNRIKRAKKNYKLAESIFFENNDEARGDYTDQLIEALFFGEKNFHQKPLAKYIPKEIPVEIKKETLKQTKKPSKSIQKENKSTSPKQQQVEEKSKPEKEITKKTLPSVPRTIARPFPFKGGTKLITGSGFVIDNGRRVVTNRHVVEPGRNFYVRNSLGELSAAEIEVMSKTDDLAVLKLKNSFAASRSIKKERFGRARAGASIAVIGFPLSRILGSVTPSITNGIVIKTTGFQENERSFQMSAKMNKGNSGGAVFDTQGNVVGVATSKLDLVEILQGDGYLPEDINFAIHSERLKSLGIDIKLTQENRGKELRLDELYELFIGSIVMVAGEEK